MKRLGFLLLFLTGACLWAVPTGLALYYNAEGNALDESGNSNNGTLAYGTTFASGKFGQGFSFDGVDDVINAGTVPNLDFSQSHSMSFWVYLNRFGDMRSNAGNKRSILMAKEIGYYGFQIQSDPYYYYNPDLTWDDSQGWISYSMCYTVNSTGTKSYFDFWSPLLGINQWHHVGVIFNKNTETISFYINGSLVRSASTATVTLNNPNTGNLYLGAYTNNCGYDFTSGRMDDVLLFNRAVSQQELSSYAAGSIPEPASILLLGIVMTCFWMKRVTRRSR